MGDVMIDRPRHRSLFWPILLIAVGVIWLLSNAGILKADNLIVLVRLWPLLLIIVGLDLLLGRQSAAAGAVIGIGAVVLIVVLMLIGPSIGLSGPSLDVTLSQYSEPRGDATSADVQLDLAVGTTTITALSDSPDLFTADVAHVGDLTFSAEGQTNKTIRLSQNQNGTVFNGLEFLGPIFGADDQKLYWNIGLNPNVPLSLTIHSGVGDSTLDLSKLELQHLSISGGVGQVALQLPSVGDSTYTADLNSGAGEFNISIAEGAALDLNLKGGVGNVTIDVPEGAAVHVDASSGIGQVTVPASFQKLSGDSNNALGDNGTWETTNFSEAARQITGRTE